MAVLDSKRLWKFDSKLLDAFVRYQQGTSRSNYVRSEVRAMQMDLAELQALTASRAVSMCISVAELYFRFKGT